MNWNEVIGQKEVQARLMQMVNEGHLPHAIMLCGPSGSGKMALAVASALLISSGWLWVTSAESLAFFRVSSIVS